MHWRHSSLEVESLTLYYYTVSELELEKDSLKLVSFFDVSKHS